MPQKQETPPVQGGASGTLLGSGFRDLDSSAVGLAPVALEVAVVASRYGLPFSLASIVAAEAGLGERLS
jgi:hypothetical protein